MSRRLLQSSPASKVLRRRHVPCLRQTSTDAGAQHLPRFLLNPVSVIQASPIIGPLDPLEHAIATGQIWEENAPPIQIEYFDANKDVLSVVFEATSRAPPLDIHHCDGQQTVNIQVQGQSLASVSGKHRGMPLSNITVLRLRAGKRD